MLPASEEVNTQVPTAAGRHRESLRRWLGVADLLVLLHEGALAPFLGVQVVHVQVPVGSSHQQSGDLLNSSGKKKQPCSRGTVFTESS